MINLEFTDTTYLAVTKTDSGILLTLKKHNKENTVFEQLARIEIPNKQVENLIYFMRVTKKD